MLIRSLQHPLAFSQRADPVPEAWFLKDFLSCFSFANSWVLNIILQIVPSARIGRPSKFVDEPPDLPVRREQKRRSLCVSRGNSLNHPRCDQRKHDLMMSHKVEAPAAAQGGTVHHIGHGAVVADKIHVHSGEILRMMP